jgi:predicted porin
MIINPLKHVTLIAGAVAALASASAMAQTSVYGLIDLGYGVNEAKTGKDSKADFHSGGDSDSSQLNSTTRVGVKGSYDLGSGVKGNFKFETAGITSGGKVGSEDGTPFFNRQAWAGVSGSFGEVRLGRQDSVSFQTMIDFDFNGASNSTMATGNVGVGPFTGRQSKALQYIAPAMGGVQFRAGVQLKGNDPAPAKDNFGFGVNYTAGALSLGAAYETKRETGGSDFTTLGAVYNFGAFKLGAIYTDGGKNATGYGLSAETKVNGIALGVQYANNTDTKRSAIELYANKELMKNLYGYVQYGSWKTPATATPASQSLQSYGVGAIYVF